MANSCPASLRFRNRSFLQKSISIVYTLSSSFVKNLSFPRAVFEGVVISTQQLQILELGLTTFLPGDDVIDIAPFGGAQTSGVLTVTITSDNRPS